MEGADKRYNKICAEDGHEKETKQRARKGTAHAWIYRAFYRVNFIGRIVSLIDEGNTIPFIARYRKEMTGAMDDQKLREISERLDYLRGLDKRREAIAASITEQGKMTDELEKKLAAAATLSELEDVYRPYKQKRRTRAMIAREKGVQPLENDLLIQGNSPPFIR